MADRPTIPYVDVLNWGGLYTKTSSEQIEPHQLRISENTDYFAQYGSFSKIRGSTRVLSTPYTELAVAKPISWIGFYKYPALDGQIKRHILVAAGTILGRIDSGAITTLLTGRLSNKIHTADRLGRFMLITNQNPDLVGDGDPMVKYDGCDISNWGLTPPGSEETIREDFDDATDWTTTFATVTNELVTTFDGDAISIDKAGSNKFFAVEKQLDTPFIPVSDGRQISQGAPNRVNFFTYIPCGMLTGSTLSPGGKFANTNEAMSVYVSPDSTTVFNNNWQFYFGIGELVEGWNQLNLDFTGGPPDGNQRGRFYPEADLIRRVRFQFNQVAAATTITGIKLDKFQSLNEGAPVVTSSGTGTFIGTYSYKVVYISKYGHMSNAGPQSVDYTATSDARLDLTNIPVSADPQVIARRLYRTVANGSVWLFLDQIENNSTTTYTDTTIDVDLGNDTPPQAGDFSDDNSPPPKGGIVKVWQRTVFIAGDPQNPETLYFSDDDEPESFPLINIFEFDAPITGMYETYSGFVVTTETGVWQVMGANPDFSVGKILDGMGCVGRRAIGTVRLEGYFIDRDGLRLYDLNNPKKVSEPIRDKYSDIDKENIEFIFSGHSKSQNTLLQFNPDSAGDYTSIFSYQYAFDEVEKGWWSTINLPAGPGLNFLDIEEIEDSNGDFRLYASAEDGMVYELFNENSKNWVGPTGTTYPIVTKVQTPYIRAGELGKEGEGVTGRVSPRFIEIRVEGDACIWTATVETADGPEQPTARDTSVISMTVGANQSLVRYPVPQDLTPATYFRITLENSQADVYSQVMAARVYFHVRPFDGQVV